MREPLQHLLEDVIMVSKHQLDWSSSRNFPMHSGRVGSATVSPGPSLTATTRFDQQTRQLLLGDVSARRLRRGQPSRAGACDRRCGPDQCLCEALQGPLGHEHAMTIVSRMYNAALGKLSHYAFDPTLLDYALHLKTRGKGAFWRSELLAEVVRACTPISSDRGDSDCRHSPLLLQGRPDRASPVRG